MVRSPFSIFTHQFSTNLIIQLTLFHVLRTFLQKTLISQKTVLEAALRKSQADTAKAEMALQNNLTTMRTLYSKVSTKQTHICPFYSISDGNIW